MRVFLTIVFACLTCDFLIRGQSVLEPFVHFWKQVCKGLSLWELYPLLRNKVDVSPASFKPGWIPFRILFCATLLCVPFAQAATLYQWSFDGLAGGTIFSTADSIAGLAIIRFSDATLATNAPNTIKYGPPNPWYNTNGTSAEFLNTPGDNDPGVGLFVTDPGVNSPLDLTTVTNLTIEGFFYPYDIRTADLYRKSGGTGVYLITIHNDGKFGFRLRSATESPPDPIECNDLHYTSNQWYHVAMVWDGTAIRFYVNGVQSLDIGTNHVSAYPFSGPIADSTRGLTIGCIVRDNLNPPANSGAFFHGRVDEIRVSDVALSPGQFLLNQTIGSPDHLVFGQQPINTVVGQPISPPVTVRIVDQFGNPVPGSANVAIAISANPGGGTLNGTLTVATTAGLATFSDLSIDQLGNGYTLIASAPGLGVTTSSGFNVKLAPRTWESGLDLHYTNGSYVMPYRLYLPYHYSPVTNYPIVIFLHGSGEYGTNNIAQVKNHIAGLIARTYADYPAILIAPQLNTSFWSDANDLTPYILADVPRNYSVDERRLYLTGVSAGGYGTTDYSRQFPTLFAALAPMSAAEDAPKPPGLLAQIPTWLFHGSADGVVPFSTSSNYFLAITGQTNLNFTATNYGYPTAISGPIRFTDFVGQGHDIWESIYAADTTDFYDWMFAQIRPPAVFGFSTASMSSGTLICGGSNSVPFGAGYLLTSTNLLAPQSQWQCVATNWADANGSLRFTNVPSPGENHRYYRLLLP